MEPNKESNVSVTATATTGAETEQGDERPRKTEKKKQQQQQQQQQGDIEESSSEKQNAEIQSRVLECILDTVHHCRAGDNHNVTSRKSGYSSTLVDPSEVASAAACDSQQKKEEKKQRVSVLEYNTQPTSTEGCPQNEEAAFNDNEEKKQRVPVLGYRQPTEPKGGGSMMMMRQSATSNNKGVSNRGIASYARGGAFHRVAAAFNHERNQGESMMEGTVLDYTQPTSMQSDEDCARVSQSAKSNKKDGLNREIKQDISAVTRAQQQQRASSRQSNSRRQQLPEEQPGAFSSSVEGMTYNERIRFSLVGSTGSPLPDVENPATTNNRSNDNNNNERSGGDGGNGSPVVVDGSTATHSQSLLVVANPVTQDHEEENGPTAMAQPFEMRSKERRRTEQMLKRLLAAVAGLLALVLLIVIIVLMISQTKTTGDKDSLAPSSSAASSTSAPSVAPTTLDRFVLDLLPEYSTVAIEGDPTSAQSMAFRFVLEDPYLGEYPSWRILQRFALATLYHSTGGDKWRSNQGWLSYNEHECLWFSRQPALYYFNASGHIEEIAYQLSNHSNPCEEEDDVLETNNNNSNATVVVGRYRHLSLASNKLYGTLPPQIGLLTSLKTINLDYASRHWQEQDNNHQVAGLGGSLPSQIGRCTDLEVLALIFNQFTGSLPSTMARLTSLWHLGLWNNRLNGTVPSWIGNLTNLRAEMSLRENDMKGTIPSQIGGLSQLEVMRWSENLMDGTLPTEIAHMTSLQRLYIENNNLFGSIPSQVGSLTKLEDFGLMGNQLSGTIPTQLGNLSSLWWIGATDNTLTGTVPTELGLLSNILWLELNGNRLSGTVPELNPEVSSTLEELLLQDNLLTGSFPNHLASLITNGSLIGLRLHGNQLTGSVSSTFCSLGEFNITGNSVYGPGLSFDCSEQLCGCDWCPCAADDRLNQTGIGNS